MRISVDSKAGVLLLQIVSDYGGMRTEYRRLKKEMKPYEKRLQRSEKLPLWDIIIQPA